MWYDRLNNYFQSLDSVERIDLIHDETIDQEAIHIKDIKPISYTSHCVGHYGTREISKTMGSILKDRKFNSEKPYTFVGPLPNYSHCLVFPTKLLENAPVPTYYCRDDLKDRNGNQYCVGFTDKGWTKVNPGDLPQEKKEIIKKQHDINLDNVYHDDDYRITNKYHREREWRIKNPNNFSLDDILAITVKNCNTDLTQRLYPAFARADLSLADINLLKDKIVKFTKGGARDNRGHFYKSIIPPIESCKEVPQNPVNKLISCSIEEYFEYAELISKDGNSILSDPKIRSEYDSCKTIDKNGITIE